MDFTMIFMVSTTLVFVCSPSTYAQTPPSPIFSPTPAPAPAPPFVNLTELLTVTGPYHTFLSYLQSTKVIETLQNQAKNTVEGLTLFVPTDDAFSSLKKPSLSNLTQVQHKSLPDSKASSGRRSIRSPITSVWPFQVLISVRRRVMKSVIANPQQLRSLTAGGLFGLSLSSNKGNVKFKRGAM